MTDVVNLRRAPERGAAGRGPGSTRRPTVALVDTFTWPSFLDFAAALRRRGVGVQRVTAVPTTRRQRGVQQVESLVFGPTWGLVHGGALTGGPPRLDREALGRVLGPDVVDLVVHDDVLLEVLGRVPARLDPSRHLGAGVPAGVLVDKREQLQLARRAGVPTPSTWDQPRLRQGPAVVKAPTGFGGFGVRVVDDQAALQDAYASLEGLGLGAPFVQRFVPGTSYGFGGVARDGEVVAGATYLRHPAPDNPRGPSVRIEVVEPPGVRESVDRMVRALGLTGFVNLQFLEGDDGEPLLIDVNLRVFGGWSMLQEVGCDLVGAYLWTLGLGPRPTGTGAPVGAVARQLRLDGSASALRTNAGVVRRRVGDLGLRWAGVVGVKSLPR